MAGRRIRDTSDAQACLEAAAGSGMKRAEWARANGIDARSSNAWRLNLGRPASKAMSGLRLVELVPDEPPVAAPFRVACGPYAIEVPSAFDEAALARLLGAVAGC